MQLCMLKRTSALIFEVLFKSVIRFLARNSFFGFIKPTGSNVLGAIKLLHVGLDVKQWRAVNNVNIINIQNTGFDLIQLNNRNANGIRTLGCPSGEKSPRFGIQEGHDMKLEAMAAVEMIEQYDVGKSIEVFQPRMVLIE